MNVLKLTFAGLSIVVSGVLAAVLTPGEWVTRNRSVDTPSSFREQVSAPVVPGPVVRQAPAGLACYVFGGSIPLSLDTTYPTDFSGRAVVNGYDVTCLVTPPSTNPWLQTSEVIGRPDLPRFDVWHATLTVANPGGKVSGGGGSGIQANTITGKGFLTNPITDTFTTFEFAVR